MAKLRASPQAAAISRMAGRMRPSRADRMTGLREPRSIAANCARSSISCGTSTGRPMDMTKSMWGSCSETAAMPRMSATVARRRSPDSGSLTYRQSEPVP